MPEERSTAPSHYNLPVQSEERILLAAESDLEKVISRSLDAFGHGPCFFRRDLRRRGQARAQGGTRPQLCGQNGD
jgi:hypothetical protein